MPQDDESSSAPQGSGTGSPLFKQENDSASLDSGKASQNTPSNNSTGGGAQRPPISTSPPPLEATAGLTKLQNSPVFPPRIAAPSSAAAAAAAAALGPLSPLTTVTSVPHQFGNGTPTMISLSTPVFMAVANSPRIQSIDVNSSPRSTVLDPRLSATSLIGSPTTFAPIQSSLTGSPVLSSTANHPFVGQPSTLQSSRHIIGAQGYPPIHAFAEEPSLRGVRKLPASGLSNPLYFSGSPTVSSPILSGLIDTPPQPPQPPPLTTSQAQQVQQMLSPLTEVNSPLVPAVDQERRARTTPVKAAKASKTSTPGQRRRSSKGALAANQNAAVPTGMMPMAVPATIPREKKRRGRPPTDKPAACSHCGATSTPEWRRGKVAEGVYVPLCNACGLQLAKRNRMQRNANAAAAQSAIPRTSTGSQDQQEGRPASGSVPTAAELVNQNATDMKQPSLSSLLMQGNK